MKYFLYIVICSLGIANTILAQDKKRLYFETGAHLGYNVNVNNINKERLQLRAYNGTSLGTYIAMKRKKYVLQLNADYVFSQYKLNYTHPQRNDVQLKFDERFGTFKYGISTGLNIPLAEQHNLEVLIGFYHAIDMVDKEKILHKDAMVAEYDAGINKNNYKIYLASRTYMSDNDYLLSHLTIKYQTHAFKIPLYFQLNITSNANIYFSSDYEMTLMAFEHDNNSMKRIERQSFENRNEIRFTVGAAFLQLQKKRKTKDL